MALDHLVLPAPLRATVPRVLVTAPVGDHLVVAEALRLEGLAPVVAPPGGLAVLLEQGGVDAVVLQADRASAVNALHRLRAVSSVPVLVVLHETRWSTGAVLEAGADDCVLAGAPRSEVAARLRVLARRGARGGTGRGPDLLSAGPFLMDVARHSLHVHGRPIHLAPKEFGLLEVLMRRDGRVVRRDHLLSQVWGERVSDDRKTVDVHVMRVRAKVEPEPSHPVHVITVRGLGYRFTA